ncbi:MAG TPA: metabolite traffic protein EboE [Planctomycetaceae bacterium]|nr:metabolite traffic protein EboE [Planctomycetaceae bacterium]
MTLSTLPLSYCTNVHPGQTVHEVLAGLSQYTLPIRSQFGQPLAAGLWLAKSVIDELADDRERERFAEWLASQKIPVYTLNAFPYGNFHSDRVKEQVYLPDWTQPVRRQYTQDCAVVLAHLLPPGVEGSISTVPLGFKALATSADFVDRCLDPLIDLARFLADLKDHDGRIVRLAIEPEPLCVLETTPETIAFFDRLRDRATARKSLTEVEEHLGVCYDVCHQAVEFEDVPASLRSLHAAGIRINKVHISCAIDAPNAGRDPLIRAALRKYIEPRYLHQTFAKTAAGTVHYLDLDAGLTDDPPAAFRDADHWRVHFHVPVDAEQIGPLGTTRAELIAALQVLPELPYAPHLEVETYTWEVLPGGGRQELTTGFARELLATQRLLDQIRDR